MAKKNAKGAAFGDFSNAPLTEAEAEALQADGQQDTITASTLASELSKEKGMAKKAKGGNGAVKKASPAAKRDKTPKTVRKCACGCGTETTGHFAPGHDARFHGWIKKLASGKMGPGELPTAVRKGLDLVQTKEGFKAKAPHYYKEA